jgi:geranylgeranyl diphosphate synthase, type II
MHHFQDLATAFTKKFDVDHFPAEPQTLYGPNRYFIGLGGKRIRPVMCLMGNELFEEILPDAWLVSNAIELFHNFTLIHDDIMDHAPLRRGMQTVHEKFGESTALLAGDVMLVAAYDYLNKVSGKYVFAINSLFNQTARQVCEGQQLDMDFEKRGDVKLDEYLHMITLKTSVLIAASLKMGAIIGGAGERNQNLLYEFGKKLGLAFQVQDDYLDAFGDPEKFGKKPGGDILSNKKTFLQIHALENTTGSEKKRLLELIAGNESNKVEETIAIYKSSGVDQWAESLKEKYIEEAYKHLDDIAVLSIRKKPLKELADFLLNRDH